MANYTEICIELDPHLIKYIAGTFPDQKVIVRKTNEFGIFVLAMLEDRPAEPLKPRTREPQPNELVLQICDTYTRESSTGKYLSHYAIDHIRRKLNKMFRTELREYVRRQHLETGIEEKYALRNFFRHYKITEDDFSEESMYRDYTRWKKSKKIDA